MPLHEYLCKKCGHRFERIQKFSDPPAKKCPECGGALEQVLHAPAVQFKGTGWHVTDYPRQGSDKASKESAAAADAKESTSEKAEVKTSSESKKQDASESKKQDKKKK
ncbi:MAG: FmdB family zinc ribbon protein [Terriglobales bacterium]